jgi:hypothetical protein
MKIAAYLLSLLTIFTCVDDALLAIGHVRPAQTFTDADDDVDALVTKRNEEYEQDSSRDERLALPRLTPKTCDALSALAARVTPSGSDLAGPLAPSPLYVFMSLRC